MPADLDGFTRRRFTFEGKTKTVYTGGDGPAVIVIHEVPGITPEVAAFARRVVDAGFTVYMPSLLGEPGRPFSALYGVRSMVHACVSREFTTWGLDKTSPITAWLRALARKAHMQCGGPGVGAIGMCLTGGFALAMMIDAATIAPVLSQPSLPFAFGSKRKAAVGLSDADFERVKARCSDGVCVLGMRFTGDRLVPRDRFETLRRELGDAFIAVEIDSGAGNAHGIPKGAHSVVTAHFVDEPGHPTRDALDQVLAFFEARLKAVASDS